MYISALVLRLEMAWLSSADRVPPSFLKLGVAATAAPLHRHCTHYIDSCTMQTLIFSIIKIFYSNEIENENENEW